MTSYVCIQSCRMGVFDPIMMKPRIMLKAHTVIHTTIDTSFHRLLWNMLRGRMQ